MSQKTGTKLCKNITIRIFVSLKQVNSRLLYYSRYPIMDLNVLFYNGYKDLRIQFSFGKTGYFRIIKINDVTFLICTNEKEKN